MPFEKIASRKTAEANAKAILNVLSQGYDEPEALFFCMNAGAALYISGYAESYRKGTDMARQALASGKALEKLQQLREFQGSA
jgi:anthranilate phosphoribosyltransferase